MQLNLKTNSQGEERVKAYLEENASEVLADKINNGVTIEKDGKTVVNKKTLQGFIKYATEQAKQQSAKGATSACVPDNVVFGWAVHYFEEDSIEEQLFNTDGTEYKPISVKTSSPSPIAKSAKPHPKQSSIFDIVEDIDQQNVQTAIKTKPSGINSMYQKYMDVQQKHENCVVAYRLGDFYEVFGDMAVKIADKCSLTLTSRDVGLENRVAMVGFPFHMSDIYFKKILTYYPLVTVDGEYINCQYPNFNVDFETGELYDTRAKAVNQPIKPNDTSNEISNDIENKLKSIFNDMVVVR